MLRSPNCLDIISVCTSRCWVERAGEAANDHHDAEKRKHQPELQRGQRRLSHKRAQRNRTTTANNGEDLKYNTHAHTHTHNTNKHISVHDDGPTLSAKQRDDALFGASDTARRHRSARGLRHLDPDLANLTGVPRARMFICLMRGEIEWITTADALLCSSAPAGAPAPAASAPAATSATGNCIAIRLELVEPPAGHRRLPPPAATAQMRKTAERYTNHYDDEDDNDPRSSNVRRENGRIRGSSSKKRTHDHTDSEEEDVRAAGTLPALLSEVRYDGYRNADEATAATSFLSRSNNNNGRRNRRRIGPSQRSRTGRASRGSVFSSDDGDENYNDDNAIATTPTTMSQRPQQQRRTLFEKDEAHNKKRSLPIVTTTTTASLPSAFPSSAAVGPQWWPPTPARTGDLGVRLSERSRFAPHAAAREAAGALGVHTRRVATPVLRHAIGTLSSSSSASSSSAAAARHTDERLSGNSSGGNSGFAPSVTATREKTTTTAITTTTLKEKKTTSKPNFCVVDAPRPLEALRAPRRRDSDDEDDL